MTVIPCKSTIIPRIVISKNTIFTVICIIWLVWFPIQIFDRRMITPFKGTITTMLPKISYHIAHIIWSIPEADPVEHVRWRIGISTWGKSFSNIAVYLNFLHRTMNRNQLSAAIIGVTLKSFVEEIYQTEFCPKYGMRLVLTVSVRLTLLPIKIYFTYLGRAWSILSTPTCCIQPCQKLINLNTLMTSIMRYSLGHII